MLGSRTASPQAPRPFTRASSTCASLSPNSHENRDQFLRTRVSALCHFPAQLCHSRVFLFYLPHLTYLSPVT